MVHPMNYKILILCPTRSRPKNAQRLCKAVYNTTASSTNVVFCIDDDDPKLAEYLVAGQDPTFYYTTGKPKRLGPWLNTFADKLKGYDIVGFLGDDVLPQGNLWDDSIRAAMVPNGIVYGNDGWQGEGLPTGVFMDARMVEKIGYMVYPELTHLYIDNHWKAWGEALGTLKYLPDVNLEHLHPYAGKAESDKVYDDANSPGMYDRDADAFQEFMIFELPTIVSMLNGDMD